MARDVLNPGADGSDEQFSGKDLASELDQISSDADSGTAERREGESFKGFELNIDKDAIANATNIPEGMKDWIAQLPDNLKFDEPVTLIVGQNASGKTQFARAVVETLTNNREGNDGRSMDYYVDRSEPADQIAAAMKPAEPRQGNIINAFLEGTKLMAESRAWSENMTKSYHGESPSASEHRLSSRQLFNQAVETVLELQVTDHRDRVFNASGDRFPANDGEVAVVFDEPEMGLSPEGQMTLAEDITRFLPGELMIVPTNNVVLAMCSDLPRLDIAHPERGVHRPSEYGEVYKLVKAE